jgi:hypothetical protein
VPNATDDSYLIRFKILPRTSSKAQSTTRQILIDHLAGDLNLGG